MDVIATKPGYGGMPGRYALRATGDRFQVPDGVEGSWFEPVVKQQVEEAKPVEKPSKKEAHKADEK